MQSMSSWLKMNKTQIELIPLTDNLFLCMGSVIKCLQEIDFDKSKIRHIENRMCGVLQNYDLKKSINILRLFDKILDRENIDLINGITHKKGFYTRDLKMYKQKIKEKNHFQANDSPINDIPNYLIGLSIEHINYH